MNRDQAVKAVETGQVGIAYWGGGDGTVRRARGKVIAFTDKPMVCIETENGERVWWRADMTDIRDA